MTVRIREDDSGEPGTLVATLTGPTTLTANAVNTFTAPDGTILERNKTYWITLREGSETISNPDFYVTTPNNDQSGAGGWSIGDGSLWRGSDTSIWNTENFSLVFALKGVVNSTSADLEHLELRNADDSLVKLTPGLRSNTKNEGTVKNATSVATIVATPRAEAATVEFLRSDGTVIRDADTVKEGHQVSLWSYRNTVRIKVTGAGGFETKNYRLTVRRRGSTTQQPATGTLRIIGTPRVGETLTVDASDVTDANGTYYAETGWSPNGRRNEFSFFWKEESDDPNKVFGIGSGTSVTLDKDVAGKRIYVSVCFRDDLYNLECLSANTGPVAPEPLVISGGSRTITGSRCDYVYPAGTHCDSESSARNVGRPLTVTNRNGDDVTSQVTFSVATPSPRIIADEFGKTHNASYEFAVTSGGQLRTVPGTTYPHLESAICTRAHHSEPCATGSISTWAADPVYVEVTARIDDDRYGTVRVPVYVLQHGTAVSVRGATDLRCNGKQCYGRTLTPGEELYAPGLSQQLGLRGINQESLRASFEDVPASHDGETAFTFTLRFSEEIFEGTEGFDKNLEVRDALDVGGGNVTAISRVARKRFDAWHIKVEPSGDEAVRIMLVPPKKCTDKSVGCTPGGKKLTTALLATVQGPNKKAVDPDEPELKGVDPVEPELTASFVDLPAEHDGENNIHFKLVFSEEVFAGSETRINRLVRQALTVTGGTAHWSSRVVRDSYDAWDIRVRPSGIEPVAVALHPPEGACTATTVACTPDGRKLQASVETRILGPVTMAVDDATVEEGPGAALEFVVRLSRAAPEPVTVEYLTADGTAVSGSDYVRIFGEHTIEAGETSSTIGVRVLDDAHDEGPETMSLWLWNARGAHLVDTNATGTITNTDLMPAAWLARFGRTVAEQVLDAVEGRIRAAPEAGVQVTVAGERLGGEAPDAEALEEAEAKARLESLSTWLADGTEAHERRLQSRSVAPSELLTGSSFALTTGADGLGGGLVSLWGRGAVSRFDGREGELSLDGEVTGALLGADWTRERWISGLMVSHARGEGSYRESGSGTGGEVSSTVTGLYPYGRYMLNERMTVWGAAGYGSGTLTLTPEGQAALETDMDLAMAAAGLRGTVVESPSEGGPELAVKTDAMGVRTTSEAVRGGAGNLAAAETDVTRLSMGLEGTWRGLVIGTGTLEPRLELGVRHDGGDAETGFGLDLGGGLAWSDPETGIRAEASGRGLLTHEADGFRERGIAGSFGWDPTPGRGPSLTLTQTLGTASNGGADALLGRRTLEGLAANDDGDELDRRRLEVKLGYGFGTFGDRFTSRPEAGYAMSESRREYSLVWRLVRDPRRGDVGSLEFALEARREASANDNAPLGHGAGFRITARW